jgi:general secretion pathway protein G
METMNAERGTMNEQPNITVPQRPAAAVHRSSFIVQRSKERGFTLIELIVVVTIIGILAGIAVINVRTAQRKAREGALRENLSQMRKALDNFYADKQHYPSNLEELVPNYIRNIPPDPITGEKDWEEVMDDPLALGSGGSEPIPAETDPQATTQPGVSDVKSRAEGETLDNVPYRDL